MFDFIKKMYIKYKEIFWYLVFGVLTTIVNIVTYFILRWAFGEGNYLYLAWTAVAWVTSVAFAYVTNRKYVFESKATGFKEIRREILAFVGCRAFSGVLDMAFMYVTVTVLSFSDALMKIASNVIVVILNYLFSKLFIFKNDK